MIRWLIGILFLVKVSSAGTSTVRWDSLELNEQTGVIAVVGDEGAVRIAAGEPDSNHTYAWVTFDAPNHRRDISGFSELTTSIKNHSTVSVDTMLWVCGTQGWSAVGDFAKLVPGEEREFRADLYELFPDKTPKINPADVDRLQIMVRGSTPDLDLEIGLIALKGEGGDLNIPPGKILVPELEEGMPSPGKRVKYRLAGEERSGIYSVLYLPPSWREGERYPVIVEYPGNIFLNAKCYSTGLPDQCVIGYGMTKGEGSILLSLPFVDRDADRIIESGFGNAEDTTAYAKAAIEEVVGRFGGDRDHMVLTGFSRGSIACGFIGLRDEEIAAFWKGIHGCQHYDGSRWRESTMEDAVLRAKRFQGKAIFQTDNDAEKYRPVVEATRPEVAWTWVNSGLGFHDTAMFLDDRPSTVKLREWYEELISSP
ncbi:hypothetical protein N9I65_02620 [bacterium]|nr:hypothetical protein [bacterium]